MSDYPIGTVCTATVRGVEGVRVMRAELTSPAAWLSAAPVKGTRVHAATDVTYVRPLVVLDLPASYRTHSEWAEDLRRPVAHNYLARQVEAAGRPPKREVYEHLLTRPAPPGSVAKSLCGKVWKPGDEDVTAVGRRPECATAASRWIA